MDCKEWLKDRINKIEFREKITNKVEKVIIKKKDLYKLVLDVLILNEEGNHEE